MKSANEILSQIDTRLDFYANYSPAEPCVGWAVDELKLIKRFIISECEHEYSEYALNGKSFLGCKKCGAFKDET